jgi:hypothetical protein
MSCIHHVTCEQAFRAWMRTCSNLNAWAASWCGRLGTKADS